MKWDSISSREVEHHINEWDKRFTPKYKGCFPNDGKPHMCFCYGACREIVGYYDKIIGDTITPDEAMERFSKPIPTNLYSQVISNTSIPYLNNIEEMVDEYKTLDGLWGFYNRQDRKNYKHEKDKIALDKIFIDKHWEIVKTL